MSKIKHIEVVKERTLIEILKDGFVILASRGGVLWKIVRWYVWLMALGYAFCAVNWAYNIEWTSLDTFLYRGFQLYFTFTACLLLSASANFLVFHEAKEEPSIKELLFASKSSLFHGPFIRIYIAIFLLMYIAKLSSTLFLQLLGLPVGFFLLTHAYAPITVARGDVFSLNQKISFTITLALAVCAFALPFSLSLPAFLTEFNSRTWNESLIIGFVSFCAFIPWAFAFLYFSICAGLHYYSELERLYQFRVLERIDEIGEEDIAD